MSVCSTGANVGGEAARWIARLDLRPHPEGGYFRETYRAAESIPPAAMPPRYDGARAFATAIYFLLPREEISAMHRLRSDELWYFHAGSPLTVVTLHPDGALDRVTLGSAVDDGEHLQATVRAGRWVGAMVETGPFALVSCSVAPGFDFADFELGDRAALLARFPRHASIVTRLTRSA